MKTFLLVWIALLLPVLSLYAQKPQIKNTKHTRYAPSLKGDLVLKQQTEHSYNKYGQIIREDYLFPDSVGKLQIENKSVYSYDSRGRHLNTLEYDRENNLVTETKIYWDEQGNKSKEEQISYREQQQVSVLTTYLLEYDAKGNRQREKFFDPDGRQVKERTWEYNEQGEILRTQTWIEPKNQPRREIIAKFQRGKNGELQKSTTIEKVNRKEFRKDIVHFNNGFVIRWRKYLNGHFDSEFINEYRDTVVIRTTLSNKRKVLSLEQAERYRRKMERKRRKEANKNHKKKDEEEIWVTNSEYDPYGNLLITTQTANDQVVTITQYTYDDYGNRTRTLKIDKQKNLKEEEKLEYDTYGHVAHRIILVDDQVQTDDHYQYEYYDRDE